MNRNEVRSVDWEKKDHNRVYRDALRIWHRSQREEAVVTFLREKNWTDGEVIGFLTNSLDLDLQIARNSLNSSAKGATDTSLGRSEAQA